ncbi:SRPBCC family protein [Halodesulfurarchaeum sp.]|uniref:SRPBCC family protein n=1 Tax=Halodesulfurarchaeum sp. TaxID=1980530 RepID=UPI002FC33251
MTGESTSRLGRLRTPLTVAETPEGIRVVISRRIEAPPKRVWDLLIDTRRWPEWGPSVLDVETQPHRIKEGSSGQVQTYFDTWLHFTVTRASEWSWAWRIGPVQATGHRVIPEGEACRVGFEVPLYAFPYVLVCWWALRRIETVATTSPTEIEG